MVFPTKSECQSFVGVTHQTFVSKINRAVIYTNIIYSHG